jgi:lipopolysaccharide/colanic/teichoic acid biosynthesis glycosyltransferase
MIKRLFDIFFSSFLLVFLSPAFLVITILVFFKFGRPIFFIQTRAGYKNQPFLILKFRSMSETKDQKGILLEDKLRLNSFGKFLRSTSLDELPTFINVLKGDMSIVGPRPLLIEYLPLYDKEQIRRHSVKPGITGWAQVNGRNKISWSSRFKFDVWYVDHKSFILDLKIILLTLKKVISREGISANRQCTMPKFTGNFK